MKGLYTLFLSTAIALSATAQDASLPGRKLVSETPVTPMVVTAPQNGSNLPATALKRLPAMRRTTNTVINPASSRRHAPRAAADGSVVFSESFENNPGTDYTWLPEGWSRQINDEESYGDLYKWFPYAPARYGLNLGPDGMYTMAIFAGNAQQDAWLITPEINVGTGMELNFLVYFQPFYFFDGSAGKVDWDNMEFIGEPTVVNTIKVMIKADGGEWQEALDLSRQWEGMTMLELFENNPTSMMRQSVSLADYAGKTIQVAFRYMNNDGEFDSVFIDAVTVGHPSLDLVHFDQPFETLFWGHDRQPGGAFVNADVAQYPVYSPITWYNTSPYYDFTPDYTWSYCVNPKPEEWATDNNPDQLTVTYKPNYTDANTTRNNLYYPPTLTASAPGYSDGTYKPSYSFLQAGGRPEMGEPSEDPNMRLGLLPFSAAQGNLSFLSRELIFGEPVTPYFGKSEYTDMIWFNETFPGEDPVESGYSSYIDGVLNFIYPASSPLVVDGVHMLAYSKHQPDAELKLEIYFLGEDYTLDLNYPEEAQKQLLATATCKGSDFITTEATSYADLATIPFDFDKPVVLDQSHTAYVVIITGFHSDKFEYFAALQNSVNHPDEMNFSYGVKHNLYDGMHQISLYPMAYVESEDGPSYTAFAINLLGTYPYLESATTEVTVPADGTPVTVELDSYYPAEELQLSQVAGLEATVSGRYGKTLLTLSHNAATVIIDGTLDITAPGVSHSIKVSESTTGINGIITDSTSGEIEAVYTVAGQQVSTASPLAPGIYVVRYTDGSTAKTVVK